MKKILSILLFSLIVYSLEAQVTKTIDVQTPGTLTTLLTSTEKTTVTDLTITGNIDARDFKCLRDEVTLLKNLNISTVSIKSFTGSGGTYYYTTYPENELPIWSFYSNIVSMKSKTTLNTIVLPENLTSIGNSAFSGCSGLITVMIPNSVTSIQFAAFADCIKLQNLTLSNSLVSIGGAAFRNCPMISNLNLPNTLRAINDAAFYGCSGITSDIVIGNSVDTLGSNSFYQCSKLKSVIIGSSVKIISDCAFQSCAALTTVTIPNSVTTIGGSAFRSCSKLTSITIPNSVTSIGSYAFASCTSMTNAIIGDGVKTIGDWAFYHCIALSNLSISNSLSTIGMSVFRECWGLTSLSFPKSVTSLGSYSFYDCRNLTEILIPNSIISIGSTAFYNCVNVTKLTISSSVISIGSEAFGATGLTSIYAYPTTPINLSSAYGVFSESIKPTCILYVPTGTKSAYQTALIWREFNNIVEMSTTAVPKLINENINIFPNPVSDSFNVSGLDGLSNIILTDINGKIILSQKISSSDLISTSALPKGFYVVKLYTRDGNVIRKIVKE